VSTAVAPSGGWGDNPFVVLLGLVLGTGLGGVAGLIAGARRVGFAELPGFPATGVASHAGCFLSGRLSGVPVLVQQGRIHLYEGHSPAEVCMGVRAMALMGAKALVLTNAAGSLNPLFRAGEVMLISDQINATGRSPLSGPNCEAFGPRFPDLSRLYDAELASLALDEASAAGVPLAQGVYLGLCGPQLETPAEGRAFRAMGADAVGMSTVLEAIAARHMGLRLLGFSALSNQNPPDSAAEAELEEIIRVAALAGEKLARLLSGLVPRLAAVL
jgi:purine-nucleoside phosphorylase